MAISFSFTSSLNVPPAQGRPEASIPFNFSGQFASVMSMTLELTGAGTFDVPFGSSPDEGALGVIVAHDPISGAAPIILKYNGAAQGKELSAGGFDICFNPVPSAGITALTITYSTNVKVRVSIFG